MSPPLPFTPKITPFTHTEEKTATCTERERKRDALHVLCGNERNPEENSFISHPERDRVKRGAAATRLRSAIRR
ncbi:hypothetical protein CCH79_00015113 [Gambusia affinis]|uniref:Uncharacterized protein n=1 Tax=Gambusia affinis TaxID=33528 RepID=A0A315W9R4_GAMAF|nr:hypothetical protein CCH79_00015113 [Gambusia affinis]